MSNTGCFPKRPNIHEDEDELLRQNREFESSSEFVPSAKLIKVHDKSSSPILDNKTSSTKKSKFAQAREKNQLKRVYDEKTTTNNVSDDPPRSLMLRDSVVEKIINTSSEKEHTLIKGVDVELIPPPRVSEKPFPDKVLWDKSISSPKEITLQGEKKKISIFAQQLSNSRERKQKDHEPTKMAPMIEVTPQNRDWGSESRILMNSVIVSKNEAQGIHSSNIASLNKMSEEQILENRKEIMEKLDSSVLEFLKKKWANPIADTKQAKVGSEAMIVENNEDDPEINTKKVRLPQNKNTDLDSTGDDPLVEKKKTPSLQKNVIESQMFPHMDTVEPEKMEWMSDIKDAEEQDCAKKQSFNARFDFNGCLLPYTDNSIPVTAGLHHHGEEPNRPGYTLEELLTLARSTFPKQRSIAFDTLSNIIKNSKNGRFDYCFELSSEKVRNDQDIKNKHVNVLVELLEADLVTLLRLALDEAAHTSSIVLDSSVHCLAQVFDNETEELALDKQFFVGFQVPQQPCLKTKICSDAEFLKDEKEMKDIQIMKSDLVLGLLRMDILDRFTYLLSVTKPCNQTVINILRILSRMCRHSMKTVSTIVNHPKLIAVVIDNFLPSRMSVATSKTSVYDTPVHNALKFIRLIMSWGRGVTAELLNKFDITSRLLVYCSLIPGESSNPVLQIQESLQLTIEAYRCWIICLCYGFLTDAFIGFHSVIMKHLIYINSNISLQENLENERDKFNCDHAVSFIQVIDCAIRCIPCEKLDQFIVVDKEVAEKTALGWEYFTGVSGVIEILENCIKGWIVQVSKSGDSYPKHYRLDLIASCFKLFSTFIQRYSLSTSYKPIEFITWLEQLIKHINSHLYKASFFSKLLSKTIEFSMFCDQNGKDGRLRDPENLPSLGATRYGGDVVGCLMEQSPFGFLNAYISLINTSLNIHKGLFEGTKEEDGIVFNLLKHESIYRYIELFANRKEFYIKTNWFARPELTMLFKIMSMDCLYLRSYDVKSMWKLGVALVVHLQPGQEYELSFLLRNIIFSPRYIDAVDEISHKFSQLGVNSDSGITPVFDIGNEESVPINLQEYLPKLLILYHDLLLPNSNVVKRSEILHYQLCFSTATLTNNSNGETIMPTDWQYLPLLSIMHQRHTNIKPNHESSSDSSANENEISSVRDCLLWVYITTVYYADNYNLSSSSIALRLSRLSTVFLAAPDLFLDKQIHSLLKHCLYDTLIRPSKWYKDGLKFANKKIPGIDSFKEYYEELINQFEAVSYGNQLFAMVLLLPLTAINSWEYRR